MTKISLQRQSPFSADLMFAMVADIDRYHEFLPYCVASRVKTRTTAPVGEGSQELLKAELMIRYKIVQESFMSNVTLDCAKGVIEARQMTGPFKHLFNQWVFEDNEVGSTIEFTLDFEFRVPLLRKIIAPLMGRAVETMVGAFEERARHIYGD